MTSCITFVDHFTLYNLNLYIKETLMLKQQSYTIFFCIIFVIHRIHLQEQKSYSKFMGKITKYNTVISHTITQEL